MTNPSSTIVQRLWNYCNVLRDDGIHILIGQNYIAAEAEWRLSFAWQV